MPLLICYDIADNSLRQKIAGQLLAYGLDRINRSVFLGEIKEKDQKKLIPLLRDLMVGKRAGPDDSLIVLPVHTHQVFDMLVFGKCEWEPEEMTGDAHTLIF